MTYSEGRGPAYILQISCGVCSKHIGVMFNHKLMDRRDIFTLLNERGTQMMCLNCHDTLMSKEGYDNQDELK
jgi:hypothetical protein